jgi:amino acid efflux transporter
MTNSTKLEKTIGLYGAITLALGIVIGAGMFSLPGLVYREAGGWAVFSWFFDALLVLPLLFIFATLGAKFPNAGGVAGFVGEAFPALKIGCSYLLLGTFTLGIPGIAITGAGYITTIFNTQSSSSIATLAFIFICFASITAWIGSKFASIAQNTIVTLLIVSLFSVIALSIPYWNQIDFSVGTPTVKSVWNGMGLAFFAYTGWELLAFTAEEFKNPQKDFPLALALSFFIVLILYLGTALSIQALVPIENPLLIIAPLLAAIQYTSFDNGAIILLLTFIVFAIIFTNLNGAIWAASRLVFDLSRNDGMPSKWALHKLEGVQATPRRAIIFILLLFALVFFLYGSKILSLSNLLGTAGQNFFVLYTLSIIAYIKIEASFSKKIFGVATLIICLAFMGIFGWSLLYALLLFIFPYLWLSLRQTDNPK